MFDNDEKIFIATDTGMNALYSISKGVREFDNFEVKNVLFLEYRADVIIRMLVYAGFQKVELRQCRHISQVKEFG